MSAARPCPGRLEPPYCKVTLLRRQRQAVHAASVCGGEMFSHGAPPAADLQNLLPRH